MDDWHGPQSREPTALVLLPFGSVCLFVSFQWLHGAGLRVVIGDLWLDCAVLTFAMVLDLTPTAVWGPRYAPVALGSSTSGRPASTRLASPPSPCRYFSSLRAQVDTCKGTAGM